jgi:hypothetical protein
MPQLQWNDVDLLEFFEVVPTIGDYETSHRYEIERAGIRLQFTVWQFESVVQAFLFRDTANDALISFAAYVRGEARLVNDERGKYLELEDCIFAPNRFWYIESGNPLNRERFPVSITVTVTVDPEIRIAFVNFRTRT